MVKQQAALKISKCSIYTVLTLACFMCYGYWLSHKNQISTAHNEWASGKISPEDSVRNRKYTSLNDITRNAYDDVNNAAIGNHTEWQSNILIYNRVHKCGSTTVRAYLHKLRRNNHFTLVDSSTYHSRSISVSKQEKFTAKLISLPKPSLYVRHLYFVDFERFGYKQPMYMNLLRDPVDRMTSQYYFDRSIPTHNTYLIERIGQENINKTINECVEQRLDECVNPHFNKTHKLWAIIPYFCGQDPICKYPNHYALEAAKRNVEMHFVVVGVLEEFPTFVRVLERLLPKYFKYFTQLYKSSSKRRQNRTTGDHVLMEKPSNATRQFLRDTLQLEYDFYTFVKQRFKALSHQLGV